MNKRCGNPKCNELNNCIDECIRPLVKALNDAGMTTIASCCGHGYQPTSIVLADGREIIILPDRKTAQMVEDLFPDIHGHPQRQEIET